MLSSFLSSTLYLAAAFFAGLCLLSFSSRLHDEMLRERSMPPFMTIPMCHAIGLCFGALSVTLAFAPLYIPVIAVVALVALVVIYGVLRMLHPPRQPSFYELLALTLGMNVRIAAKLYHTAVHRMIIGSLAGQGMQYSYG